MCQLAPSCADVTVVTNEWYGEGWVVVVVELVAGAAIVVLTDDFSVVAVLGVAPHPANANSPTDAPKSAIRRSELLTSRSVGALVTIVKLAPLASDCCMAEVTGPPFGYRSCFVCELSLLGCDGTHSPTGLLV